MTASIPPERLAVATLVERPELRAQLFSAEFAAAVPEFLRHDPTASLYYAEGALDRYLAFSLAPADRDQPDRVLPRALRLAITLPGAAATGCPMIPGCACTCAPARRSSRLRRAAW